MFICTCVKFSMMNWWRPFERHAVPRRCSGRKEVESIKSFFTRLLLITTTRTQSKFSRNYILYRIFRTVRIWVWNSNRLCNTTLHDWLKKTRATFSSNHWEVKLKPAVTRSHPFSRASPQQHVITSSFNWFSGLLSVLARVITFILVLRHSFKNHCITTFSTLTDTDCLNARMTIKS